ncbi:MAG: NADH dehydrogenase (quinone) subunit D [Candidatus Eisenbacteria bacterium]|nr:NADH dehydrogenase (quinone) subunit D [Candidatus Eisenbacteria bacterium]
MATSERMILNIGPQHPSTHGVLRLVVELEGETVVKVTPHIGYLHRAIEKLCETKTYHQCIPLTDRLDYLAPLSNNLGYVLAVEKLLGLEVPRRAQYLRVLMAELTRISSHLIWLGTHAMDVGAISVFLYTFRERETTYDLFELAHGARMNVSYMRVGGLARDIPPEFTARLKAFMAEFTARMDEYETLLTKNRIWLNRTRGVGCLSGADAVALGVSGPNLRASGVDWDIRRAAPYSAYDEFDFRVAVGQNGDVYDRYLVRLTEMRESLKIVRQAFEGLPDGPVMVDDPKVAFPPKERLSEDMESLIHHFKLVSEGFSPPEGEVYSSIEAPKGELGFYVVSDGGPNPYRIKVRPPSFVNLQALPKMAEGRLIADLVAIVGSIDIVLGEVDR